MTRLFAKLRCSKRQLIPEGRLPMAGRGDGVCASNTSPGPRDPLEQRYLQLLEHTPDPLCVHAEGRVVYVNPAAVKELAARSTDDVVGRMITDFVHPNSVAPMLARIAALRQEGDSSPPSEAVMLRLDGSAVEAEVVSVLTQWDGKPAYQVIFRVLTLFKAAQARLHLQAALVTYATDAIIATTLTGTVTSWNRAAETIYQLPTAHALALPISEAVGAPIDPAAIVARGGVEHSTHRAADGSARTVRVVAAVMNNGYVLICSDHTALRRAERRLQAVVNSLEEGVVICDAHAWPESINPAGRRILGLPPDGPPLDGLDMRTVFPLFNAAGEPLNAQRPLVAEVLATGVVIRNRIIGFDRPDGTRCWLSASLRPLDDGDTGQPAVLASITDVTDQHNARLQLDHQAHHDSLTGLPNRAYAEARTSQALLQDHAPALSAVMFIDLDNIKAINDAFGHHAGDLAIATAAQRLRSTLRSDDFLARHGGDEFVALLFGQADRAALKELAEQLHAGLATTPLDVAGTPRILTASIGIAQVRTADPRDAAQILRAADAAMYKAKQYRATTYFADNGSQAPEPQRR
jgi:diguanylate cyclase (GGDEF)-like protein/PAS domain S-box-containing protein